MAATIFAAYCVGNIVGPQLVKSQTRPQHYPELWLGLIIWCVFFLLWRRCLTVSPLHTDINGDSYVICIAASVTLYAVLAAANKKKAALPENEAERAKLAFQDLTDIENPYFRYVL